MDIRQDYATGTYQIKAYEPGKITVNEVHFDHSIVVSSDDLITNWTPQSLGQLKHEHFTPIIALDPEIVLLGTGKKFIMPPDALLVPLYDNCIGVECMDTGAACRTYMALLAENRKVVAALLID